MPAYTATAPGKIILFGEHAVVFGRPAIAIPVFQVRARAVVTANPRGRHGHVMIEAPDIQLESALDDLPDQHPLAMAIRKTISALGVEGLPACTVRVTSTIPLAAGLGSGAAVSVALIRALGAFLGHPLDDEQVSTLAFEVEKLYHGTPSGIDNSVITYAKPVFFIRGQTLETLQVARPFTVVIGDTGIASPTAVAVGDVRQAWKANPALYEALFDAAGEIARQARRLIETGDPQALGPLMDRNHAVLQEMGVSSPELDRLVAAARQAGAWGAKLSGAGRGGNMIALSDAEAAPSVAAALEALGAARTIITTIQ